MTKIRYVNDWALSVKFAILPQFLDVFRTNLNVNQGFNTHPFFRFLPWKHELKKPRSKSCSRIEGRKNKPMILNDDILDAIRNKKYALKKVEPPILGKIKKKLMLYHFLLKKTF